MVRSVGYARTMTEGDGQLEARLAEQEVFEPPESFVEQANVSDSGVYDEFEENWPECWEGRLTCSTGNPTTTRCSTTATLPSTSGSRAAS